MLVKQMLSDLDCSIERERARSPTRTLNLAQAMVTTAWNLAIAAGGAIGGTLLTTGGTPLLPPVVAALAVLAFITALAARRFAFPPGRRAHSTR